MRRRIHFPKIINRHGGVNLRRRHACVPQEFLNRPNIRATLKKVSRIRVAQRVRSYRIAEPTTFRCRVEKLPYRLPAQTVTPSVQK